MLHEFDRRLAFSTAKWSAIGLVVAVMAIIGSTLLDRTLPLENGVADAVVRFLSELLSTLGIGFAPVCALYLLAGAFGAAVPDWSWRRRIAFSLVALAILAFLFVPTCWSPISDDCRSSFQRLRDAFWSAAAVAAAFVCSWE